MSFRVGTLLAALVAGPPLYGLVQAGLLDSDTALTRVFLVAVACTVGVGLIVRIAKGYQAEAGTPDPAPAGGDPALVGDPVPGTVVGDV